MEVLEHVTGIVVDHCLAGPGGVTSGGWWQFRAELSGLVVASSRRRVVASSRRRPG
jgi:hypothetical protein